MHAPAQKTRTTRHLGSSGVRMGDLCYTRLFGWICTYRLFHVCFDLFVNCVRTYGHPTGGDASTRYLASFQDAEMAALKDSVARPEPPLYGSSTARAWTRQLLPVRRDAHKARTRRLSPNPVHVVQRQDSGMERPRHTGRTVVSTPATSLHRPSDHRRSSSLYARGGDCRLHKSFICKAPFRQRSVVGCFDR